MKKIVYLCVLCTVISAILSAVSAADPGDFSGFAGTVSEQQVPGNEAGSTPETTVSETQTNGNSAESGMESGSGRILTERSVSPLNETTESAAGTNGVSWFTVLLAIIVVAAVFAIVVALLPKRRGM